MCVNFKSQGLPFWLKYIKDPAILIRSLFTTKYSWTFNQFILTFGMLPIVRSTELLHLIKNLINIRLYFKLK